MIINTTATRASCAVSEPVRGRARARVVGVVGRTVLVVIDVGAVVDEVDVGATVDAVEVGAAVDDVVDDVEVVDEVVGAT